MQRQDPAYLQGCATWALAAPALARWCSSCSASSSLPLPKQSPGSPSSAHANSDTRLAEAFRGSGTSLSPLARWERHSGSTPSPNSPACETRVRRPPQPAASVEAKETRGVSDSRCGRSPSRTGLRHHDHAGVHRHATRSGSRVAAFTPNHLLCRRSGMGGVAKCRPATTSPSMLVVAAAPQPGSRRVGHTTTVG